ncbi:MAG: Na/Pi symporter, partial [Spirochaetales bacterium]|nr:Na/Pi symporter [Spirochaetales bacterium]
MTTIEILTIITTMLGGLALFLTGMDTLSESLTALTGGALKKVVGGITKNRFLAYFFGTVVTAVVQSSSAITVLSVGLVNSGIIELGNAAGL